MSLGKIQPPKLALRKAVAEVLKGREPPLIFLFLFIFLILLEKVLYLTILPTYKPPLNKDFSRNLQKWKPKRLIKNGKCHNQSKKKCKCHKQRRRVVGPISPCGFGCTIFCPSENTTKKKKKKKCEKKSLKTCWFVVCRKSAIDTRKSLQL